MDLRGKRIVVTGPTGQWAKPTTIALAADNEVFGLARFGDAAVRVELEAAHTDAPSVFNPIHEDDILASLGPLLDAASVPATIVNWGGSEAVSVGGVVDLPGRAGRQAGVVRAERPRARVGHDRPDRQDELLGPTTVHWRDGFRRMVEAFHPELTLADV